MPKMTDRERLAKIETDQQNLAREAEIVRRALRSRYGDLATGLAVERLSERDYKDVLVHAIRVGGPAALAALKALPAAQVHPDARRNGDAATSTAKPRAGG